MGRWRCSLAVGGPSPIKEEKHGQHRRRPQPTVVLVHGAWGDATGFDGVIRALHDQGYRAIGFANPLRGLQGDAQYLADLLKTIEGPIVLVGHSYGER